jgi:hypothetical protein
MDGKPYAVGQTVLFASAYGSTAKVERREVVMVGGGRVRVENPKARSKVGGWLVHPERHYIPMRANPLSLGWVVLVQGSPVENIQGQRLFDTPEECARIAAIWRILGEKPLIRRAVADV